MRQQIAKGNNLMTNLYNWSLRSSNPMQHTEKVDVVECLCKAISHAKDLNIIQPCEIQIQTTPQKPLFMRANALLTVALQNLVNNAIKHNDKERAQIIINVERVITPHGTSCRIEINDNGPGIPPEVKERLLDKSYAFIDETGKKGMGIRFTLVKQIIHGFQGSISIRNRVDEDHIKGATVSL